MSGLLVKSTAVMRENLRVLNERGLRPRVLLGGAALTRRFVEEDLRAEYEGEVSYAKDAFEGLRLMEQVMAAGAEQGQPQAARAKVKRPVTVPPSDEPHDKPDAPQTPVAGGDESTSAHPRGLNPAARAEPAARTGECVAPTSDTSRNEPVPEPPFFGSRVWDDINVREVLPLLNENMLFKVQWQYRAPRGRR